jgi:hypothetical protein
MGGWVGGPSYKAAAGPWGDRSELVHCSAGGFCALCCPSNQSMSSMHCSMHLSCLEFLDYSSVEPYLGSRGINAWLLPGMRILDVLTMFKGQGGTYLKSWEASLPTEWFMC